MRAVLHVRADLCFVKNKALARREVPLTSIQDAHFFAGQFGFVLQMTPKLDLAGYFDTEDPNTPRNGQSYSLELRRYNEGVLLDFASTRDLYVRSTILRPLDQ